MGDEQDRLKKEAEEFDVWINEQKGNSTEIVVHRGNATKKEWKQLLEYLEENDWDYEEEMNR